MEEKQDKILISVTEASQLLGLSRPTVYRLINSGDFPVVRVFKRTMINRALLVKWANERTGVSP